MPYQLCCGVLCCDVLCCAVTCRVLQLEPGCADALLGLAMIQFGSRNAQEVCSDSHTAEGQQAWFCLL